MHENFNVPETGKTLMTGNCNDCMALISLDATFVSSLLPEGLVLGTQSMTPEGQWPVLLQFANQEYYLTPMPVIHQTYKEASILIPFVEYPAGADRKEGPYAFVSILYLDNFLTVLGGRLFYEFNKHLARIKTTTDSFDVRELLLGTRILDATWSNRGTAAPCETFANFNALIPILSLPCIEYGIYGFVTSNYVLSYEGQMLQPLNMKVTSTHCDYLPKGDYSIPSIADNLFGAFQMSFPWTLSFAHFIPKG